MSEELEISDERKRDILDCLASPLEIEMVGNDLIRTHEELFFEYEQTLYQANEQIQQQSNEESNVIHKCYICDSNILKNHALRMYHAKKNKPSEIFIQEVTDQQTKKEFNKIWNSKHIKFLCCKCVEEMKKLEKDRKNYLTSLQNISNNMLKLGFNTIDLNVIIDDLKNKLENNKLPHFIELKELHEQLKKKNNTFTHWLIEPTENINTIHIPVYIFEQPYDNEYHILNGTLQINAGISLDNDISQPLHIYFTVSEAIRECRYNGIGQPTIIIYSNNETQQEALQHIHEFVNVSEYDRIIQRADVENWLVDNRIQQNRMYFICRKNQNRENLFMCIKTGELTLSQNND